MGRKHNHKYFRLNMNGQKVWACGLPDCTHYMPKHLETLVIGKTSICWQCESEFRLGPLEMEMDRPICNDCAGFSGIIQEFDKKAI